jgi:hypothetical protein
MDQVHSSDSCNTNILALENYSSYWRLEREETPEEADEMERLKERQREREEELAKEEEREEPVLA